jgi:hypothetical protein
VLNELSMAWQRQAFWVGSSGCALLLASACITPPLEAVASNARTEPAPSPVASSTATTSAEPVQSALVSKIPVPANGVLDWKTPTPPSPCSAPPDADGGTTDSGAIVATSATVDFAKLDAGAPATMNAVPNAAQVVTEMRPGFRACYQRVLAKDRSAAGTVDLRLKVSCEGSVVWIHATTEHLPNELLACMADIARAARFEQPTGGYAIIRVPVQFRPN